MEYIIIDQVMENGEAEITFYVVFVLFYNNVVENVYYKLWFYQHY